MTDVSELALAIVATQIPTLACLLAMQCSSAAE